MKLQDLTEMQQPDARTEFGALFKESIVPLLDRIQSQFPDIKHDPKQKRIAGGRWTIVVPADQAEKVQNVLVTTLTELTGDTTPTSGKADPSSAMNAWETLDFDMNFKGLPCTMSMQWNDVGERKSSAEHLRHPPFRIFSLDYSAGTGVSLLSHRPHKGI